jgi:hypothetical protein
VQEQIHKISKNQAKPTPKSNRHHRRVVAPKQPPTTHPNLIADLLLYQAHIALAALRRRTKQVPRGTASEHHTCTRLLVVLLFFLSCRSFLHRWWDKSSYIKEKEGLGPSDSKWNRRWQWIEEAKGVGVCEKKTRGVGDFCEGDEGQGGGLGRIEARWAREREREREREQRKRAEREQRGRAEA